MKKDPDRYIFPAIFSKDEEGMWDVRFPDLDNCFTSADTLEEAIDQAKYTLEDCLYFLEKGKEEIPAPSDIPLKQSHDSVTQLVVAFMPPVRRAWSQKAVKKTLTIPAYLAELAEEQKLNYSALLQQALKQELRVQ